MKNYKYLNLPASSIISKTIFKKQFYSNADISSSDIALFTNRISKITWLYSLRPDTINVQPYKDEIREYTEIEIIEVEITVDKGIGRIAEIIIKSIPYPILLIFRLDDKTAFYAALQRTNLSDCSKNIIEQTVKTDWLDPDSTLFAMLNFKKFRFMNYFTIYTDLVDTISVYNIEKLVDDTNGLTGEQARAILAKAEELERQIAMFRAELKQETQFNRKMELNLIIKDLESQRKSF